MQTMSSEQLRDTLLAACSCGYAACRAITRLVPVGGEFDRVMPPTYSGGKYATEQRRWNGQAVNAVLLDSVQSQSNRMELALLQAVERGEIQLPLIRVAFENGKNVTTLDAPHRVADAIFRDCNLSGKPFRDSEIGRQIFGARAENATGLFRFAPTALLFGMWDSTDLLKRPGARVARALVSEIVGVGAIPGVRTASRIDPLGIRKSQRKMYLTADGRWTFDETKAATKKDSKGKEIPVVIGKPSEANHGNIPPDITHEEKENGKVKIIIHGGMTILEAVQTTVLSFAQLRQIRFPCGKSNDILRDRAGRAVLAALGIYAVLLQWRDGYQLRSRCQLIPKDPSCWEFLKATAGGNDEFEIPIQAAREALDGCLAEAKLRGLEWCDSEIALDPSPDFAQLVRENDDYGADEPTPE